MEEGVGLIWHIGLWEDFLIKYSRQKQLQEESSLQFMLEMFVFSFTLLYYIVVHNTSDLGNVTAVLLKNSEQ